MKTHWIILIAIAGVGVLVGSYIALSKFGMMPKISWQQITILAASFFGPAKALFDKFFQKNEVDQLAEKQKAVREAEEKYRKDMDAKVNAQQQKLAELTKEIEVRNAKLEVIEERKKRLEVETKSLTVEQTKTEAQTLFGS